VGKEGNRRRREARRNKETGRFASLDENIQAVLDEDDRLAEEAYKSGMASILGQPGPPTDNVVWLGLPPDKPKRKIVDCLGRVREVDDTPNTILKAPMAQQTTLSLENLSKRRVTLMRDHELTYPEIWMEVFVQPDPAVKDDEARFANMFARSRCSRAKSVLEADLVVFAGGDDVDPVLYGEIPHPATVCNPKRDEADIALYLLCLEHGIPMFGVCRGAQFLHVMNGGKLWQHVDRHYGDHRIYDIKKRDFVQKVSSVHHQMVRLNTDNGMELIATNGDARNRWANPTERAFGAKADIEAFFYRDTCCLGVQGHPEYAGYNFYTKWCLDLINDYILSSPDIEWRDGQRRIKTDLLEERKLVATPPPKLITEETKGL
jgi:gamma-glutamyl-gamma-aminobutyrate hydrolase PuuD